MSNANFIDYVKIFCRSGKGGSGSAHLHRDKLTRKGGPDGGDGGRGGHVILKGNDQLWTLLHLKYRKHVFATSGESGGSSLKTGSSGDDAYIEVPLGTVARDAETNEVLFEITVHHEKKILIILNENQINVFGLSDLCGYAQSHLINQSVGDKSIFFA